MNFLTVNAAGKKYVNFAESELRAIGVNQDVIEAAKILQQKQEVNEAAEVKITAIYPLYKQINIMRSGTQVEQQAMYQFIDAVRAWSNGADPQQAELDVIQP